MPYAYTLKLTSPSQQVNLPVKLENVSKLRLTAIRYVTGSANQSYMLINFRGWNENSWYFDGVQIKQYTRNFILSPVSGQMCFYANYDVNAWDVVKNYKSEVSNFQVDLLIDGEYNTDITSLNPVYIELYAE